VEVISCCWSRPN